jgi:dephospho-CoA kinase
MRIYGLTGGIGSGKSTVAALFERCGIPVLSADALAHDAVSVGTEGLREVVDAFSSEILNADGSLDRRKLGQIVFNDPTAKRRLEGIVHPRVQERFLERARELSQEGVQAMIYEVPILFERDLDTMFAATILVCSPEADRIRRVTIRDSVSEREVQDRIHNQLPDNDKRARATYVINNDAELDALREQVAALALEVFGQEMTADADTIGEERPS